MPTPGFDIASLLDFSPPAFFCERCRCLFRAQLHGLTISKDAGATCSACHVRYIPTNYYTDWNIGDYLRTKNLQIEFKDLIGHSRTLAAIAWRARNYLATPLAARETRKYLPMRALFEALLHADAFVHFTTYGISPLLIGAIKMAAQRVPVRGIISNSDEGTKDEFTKYIDEAPNLDIKLYGRSDRREDWEAAPHQKLVIIDGLLAFKGSANLTVNGWRKAAQGLDVIELVTDVNEVIELHNRYFSPLWGQLSGIGHEITMDIDAEDIPF